MAQEDEFKVVIPNNPEAERSVIGSMLLSSEAVDEAQEILKEEDFYNRQLGTLFSVICDMHEGGGAVDVVTLMNRLRDMNVTPELSSPEYIRSLMEAVPYSTNVADYARIVADKSALRQLIRMCEETIGSCYQSEKPLTEIMNDAEQRIFRVTQRGYGRQFVPIGEIVMQALDNIEKASKTDGNVTGIPTGFTELDYKTAGLQNSDLILIAARPSMGKSALALSLAENVTRKGYGVALFSLEMSSEQLVKRLFSMKSHVDSQSIRTGEMTDKEWEDLIEGAGELGRSRLIIDDTPGITVAELRSRCRKYKMEHGLDLIMIDYLQLMTGSSVRASDSRQQEVSDISRSLKALARELNVPVIALSQLSRAVESRPDHRPMLSDLRESGAIEQDADIVMFIYRDEYYNKDSEKKGVAEIIIAKQRNGPVGTVELSYIPKYTRFANLQHN